MQSVPLLCRPLVLAFWGLWGAFIYLLHGLLFFTCRKEVRGAEHLRGHRNVIHCGWHETLVPFLVTYLRFETPHVQLVNNAWFMGPVHFIAIRMRMGPLVRIDAGTSGAKAAAIVVAYLRQGHSTLINPDGPTGPAKELRKGVLRIAAESGVPILPFKTYAPHAWVWTWSWDKKRVPLPFSRIVVEYQAPIFVTDANLDEATKRLQQALG